jgi:hypothetical protein
MEERVVELPKEKECEGFLDHLKQHFKVAGGRKTAAQAQAQREVRAAAPPAPRGPAAASGCRPAGACPAR